MHSYFASTLCKQLKKIQKSFIPLSISKAFINTKYKLWHINKIKIIICIKLPIEMNLLYSVVEIKNKFDFYKNISMNRKLSRINIYYLLYYILFLFQNMYTYILLPNILNFTYLSHLVLYTLSEYFYPCLIIYA